MHLTQLCFLMTDISTRIDDTTKHERSRDIWVLLLALATTCVVWGVIFFPVSPLGGLSDFHPHSGSG